MADFRCPHCGKMLSADPTQTSAVECTGCGNTATVPGAANEVVDQARQPKASGARQGALPEGTEGEEEDQSAEAVMGAMTKVMPWVISLFFHLGLFLIMAFVVMIVYETGKSKDIVVPGEFFVDNPEGAVNPGRTNPELQNTQPQPTESQQWAESEAEASVDSGETSETLRIPGLGAGGAAGGALAPTGLTPGGSGPPAGFIGQKGNAHHVVYVIDRSGSMLETFDAVRREMLKSIARLSEVQDFHIILFQDQEPIEMGPRRLVPATREYKLQAVEFLEPVFPEGLTNPVPALKRAFEVLQRADRTKKGKMIFLLTDGVFPDNDAVLKAIDNYNDDKKVSIFTYLYGNQPPEAEKVLKQIADQNRGKYKFVPAY